MAGPSWITPLADGLHLPGCDVWIDPAQAVGRALVTHGHADHARGGHGELFATRETAAIMALRYGVPATVHEVALRKPIALGDGVSATFFPAGHVLGSAQILLDAAASASSSPAITRGAMTRPACRSNRWPATY